MNNAQRRAKMSSTLILLAVFSTLAVWGCEDPGTVGGGFTDTDTSIRVDTIGINEFGTDSFNHFSGRLTYFSAGRFSDPAFGDMSATGLIRPSLGASTTDTMEENAGMKLRLFIDQSNVYGDSAEAAEFDLVELNQVWRGKAWRIHDEVTLSDDPAVGSFTVERQDSIDIALSGNWLQKYRSFFMDESADRDSLYRIEFPGLAVVPRNTAKILPFYADSSRFIIENPDADTVEVGSSDWAYSLQRTNQPQVPSGESKLHSTMEQLFSFDVGLTRDDLGTVNISRVELVLFDDSELLENSLNQVSPTAGRPDINSARIHLAEPGFVPIVLDPGSPLVSGAYNGEDGSYRFNMTNFVNGVLLDGVSQELKFYITLQSNNGIVRSSFIHNLDAADDKAPKVIVTSLEIEEGSN